MAGDIVLSGGMAVDDQGNRSFSLGGVSIVGTLGAPNILNVDGAITTFHDFLMIPATEMTTTGTAPSAATAGAPRCILAKGEKVVFARAVPAGWNVIGFNVLFMQEVEGAGAVHWQLDYDVVNFLTGDSLTGGLTTIDFGTVAVPGVIGESEYFINSPPDLISAPQQPFGIPPIVRGEIVRVDDSGDTFGAGGGARDIGVTHISMSRA